MPVSAEPAPVPAPVIDQATVAVQHLRAFASQSDEAILRCRRVAGHSENAKRARYGGADEPRGWPRHGPGGQGGTVVPPRTFLQMQALRPAEEGAQLHDDRRRGDSPNLILPPPSCTRRLYARCARRPKRRSSGKPGRRAPRNRLAGCSRYPSILADTRAGVCILPPAPLVFPTQFPPRHRRCPCPTHPSLPLTQSALLPLLPTPARASESHGTEPRSSGRRRPRLIPDQGAATIGLGGRRAGGSGGREPASQAARDVARGSEEPLRDGHHVCHEAEIGDT